MHALIRRSLTIAVRWGLVGSNPANLVEPPALTQHEIQPYSLVEARQFLDAVRDDRLEARWVIAIALGLRQGEALGLDGTTSTSTTACCVFGELCSDRLDGPLTLIDPKTARSRRAIPLPPTVVEALHDRRLRQDAEREKAGALWQDTHKLVFTTTVGTPIHPRNDLRAFRLATQRAGLRRIRLHDLRHTTATLLLAEGVSARVVMEILGHSQISVTLNTYSHVAPDLARAATTRIEEALWNKI